MKKYVGAYVLLASVSCCADSVLLKEKTDQPAINIQNQQMDMEIYLNGVERLLRKDSGLRVSCLAEEWVEIQINEELHNVTCGAELIILPQEAN